MQKIKKPISIILSILMVVSMFVAVPITASAEVGDFVPESDYLTFTAVEANSSVTLNVSTGSNLKYNLNGAGWESYSKGTQITLANVGDYVRFCGNNTTFDEYNHHVSIGGKVACSGNVMSLRLDDNGKSQGLSYDCFENMFMDCTGLTAAPELPETNLAESCYYCMFYGCTSLTTAPALPATALADYCYYGMFAGCTSLTTAPVLPATMLAESCYDTMFYGCTSLTTAPALPATMLAEGCYFGMFAGCESLTTAPELPATTLAAYCYNAMFSGCTSLTTAPALPATTLAEGCYSAMFYGCSSIKLSKTETAEYSIPYSVPSGGNGTTADYALDNMFDGTGGTFTGTPAINTTYYMYVPKYTVTWKNGDTVLETDTDVAEGTTPTYDGATPEKASNTYYDYTFSGWTPAVAPVTEDVTYTAQFTATAKTFKVYVKKLIGGTTYTIENLTGETTVAQLKEIIADQIDIPATAQRLIFAGKEIEDAKTLAENNIQKESTFHLIIRGYTVTWKNWDETVLETDTGVAKDSTPTYDGETPTKPEDEQNTYTFAGWSPEVSAVTGNATYTAQFDATPKVVELPEVIKDCTNTRDSVVFANVPFIQPGDFSTLADGAINFVSLAGGFALFDAKDYSYKFYDKNGTEIAATLSKEQSVPGSAVGLSDDVTIYNKEYQLSNTELDKYYIVATAPAPAPAQLILNVGENGKVVMNNGTFGNATDASNITEIPAPFDVIDGGKVVIADGHSVNLVEGGSINIATGGEVSFYPSADNTGKITAIPNEGYICTGWYNGDTRYTTKDTIDYQAISEDMTLTAKFALKLFTGHSVTLGGDVGVNFFLNPDVLNTYSGTKTVKFTVDGKETTVAVPGTPETDGYKVTCNVVAAQMAHKIKAVVYVNGTALDQTDSYSVQDYAEAVYAEPAKYLPSDEADKAPAFKALAAAMLHYGAEAQTVFAEALNEHPYRADKNVAAADYSGVTKELVKSKINGTASNLNEVATQLDAKYYTNSLIYMQNNTLRVYFTPKTYPADMPNAGKYDGSLSGYYYYKDVKGIAAAELDDQQEFSIAGVKFTYSPLNYVADVLSSNMSPDQKNLAKALFLYNQKANAFFDEPAPAQNVVDLGALTGDYEAQNNDVLTGTLAGQYKITIADGATVTLKDATITCLSSSTTYDGIALLGDATILLEGENTVKGGNKYNAGIFVPEEKTLTIDGTGSLNVSSGGSVAAIGAKRSGIANGTPGGNIVINGGTINATGGNGGAGIGGCTVANCGTITINGGNITAVGKDNAPGIGSGNRASYCAGITINGGTVTATGNNYAAGIGSGQRGSCGDITIAATVTQVTATKGDSAPNSIGAGYNGSCGTISIADPSKVTQN